MPTPDELKSNIREKYSEIARQPREENAASCCGVGGCCADDATVFAEDYAGVKGYEMEADLGLGCGIPTAFAQLRKGDTVVDLGSGAGNDVFVARAIVGESGTVIGVDMTDAMLAKARVNNSRLGYTNVEFRLGEIENLPVANDTADAVISNCVLNLVPDKKRAFAEIYRILKPGGHFSISDIVVQGVLPEEIRNAAELYAGCVAGAMTREDYLAEIRGAGFTETMVVKEKASPLPSSVLEEYLSPARLAEYRASGSTLLSVTVYAVKPRQVTTSAPQAALENGERCCPPGSGCC
jgi:arsenite methyltransferase